MPYLKINDIDFSMYVNSLAINKNATYTAQVNANGDTVADYINSKRQIDVGIIPLNEVAMKKLQEAIDKFNVTLSFLNPITNELEENINCIIPSNAVSYYTIQANKVLFNAFSLSFTEL